MKKKLPRDAKPKISYLTLQTKGEKKDTPVKCLAGICILLTDYDEKTGKFTTNTGMFGTGEQLHDLIADIPTAVRDYVANRKELEEVAGCAVESVFGEKDDKPKKKRTRDSWDV